MSVAKVGVYNRTQSQAIDRMASAYQNASAETRANMAGRKIDIGNGVRLTHRQAYQTQQVMKGNARFTSVRDSKGNIKMSTDKGGNQYMHVRVRGNSSPRATTRVSERDSKRSFGYASRAASANRTARANERRIRNGGSMTPQRTNRTVRTNRTTGNRYTRNRNNRRRGRGRGR